MPADYQSTAKALALPISPLGSPSPELQNRAPWSRNRTLNRRRLPASTYNTALVSYKERIIRNGNKVIRKLVETFKKLTLLQKIAVVTIFIVTQVLVVLFLVYNEKIFGALAPLAEKWHDTPGGWVILWLMTFTCAFPPLIGYSSTITIAGFVYGFPHGWFIVASATVAGSTASFLASRTVLSKYVHKLVGGDKRFEALALTLKHDGLKILCMIRLCPLPYSISNAAMSTFPTVHPLSFALATAITSPKLLIHVFIGSRLASLAEDGGKMDGSTKAINYASIIFGAVLGAAVGWIIYSRTVSRAKELEIEELEAAARGGATASPPRNGGYQDDDLDTDAAALMGDDDISLWENDGTLGYRDDFTDEEDDPFSRGDLDEEAAVEGQGQRKP